MNPELHKLLTDALRNLKLVKGASNPLRTATQLVEKAIVIVEKGATLDGDEERSPKNRGESA